MEIENKIDEYLDGKYGKGYVYFVYSHVTNMIYVGETNNIYRINIYLKMINEENSRMRIINYNYYTNNKTINLDLAYDITNSNNNFQICYFRTRHNKYMEKNYINYLMSKRYRLYNGKKYKSHSVDLNAIDDNIIKLLPMK